jgi:hypothetical protein
VSSWLEIEAVRGSSNRCGFEQCGWHGMKGDMVGNRGRGNNRSSNIGVSGRLTAKDMGVLVGGSRPAI